jgi:hypothetical protein
MRKDIWIAFSSREKRLLIDALRSSSTTKGVSSDEIGALVSKLGRAKSHPQITVGVEGGLVQWTLGNPFPIRICDYDVEGQEGLDLDEQDEPCRIWYEPADPKVWPPSEGRGRTPKDHSRSLKR